MNPTEEAALVARLKAFNRQPTLSKDEAEGQEEPEMVSVARLVRHKRGSWWQLAKNYKDSSDDNTAVRK
jgi:hypothetical protein